MKQIVAELLDLLEREPGEKELWQNELEKLRQCVDELKQAHSDARERYNDRIAELRDEADELQGKLAIQSFNDPANAKKIAEEMANVNAVLKAAESISVFDYCVQQTQKEREKIGQAYLAAEQAEQLFWGFRREINEVLDKFERALREREEKDSRYNPREHGLSRYTVDNIADILVGEFKSEPGKPMPRHQRDDAMNRLLGRYKSKALQNTAEIIEKQKAKKLQ